MEDSTDVEMEIVLPKEFENVMRRFNKVNEPEKPKYEELETQKPKKKEKIALSELKKLAKKPEMVDWVDCDAKDPLFLVELKSTLNTIPVPAHWSSKRKYLQSKRGIEKLPYELPSYIANTNISELRQAGKDKEDQQKLKQKVRARLHGKIHKLDIDYEILHDAFFKNQVKPQLTKFGECFYEGKEFELKIKAQRAGGELSEELKRALGMGSKDPPPYLYNMQRYGMPPSYPQLRIPGVNSPIPKGASWGFHTGGYGKPPVDLHGRALYGDVFGLEEQNKVVPKNWIPPTFNWGGLIDDTKEDDMEIDQIKSMPAVVDIMQEQTIDRISQKEKKKTTPHHYKPTTKMNEPAFTLIDQEKSKLDDKIIGTDKKFKIPPTKRQLPDTKQSNKKRKH